MQAKAHFTSENMIFSLEGVNLHTDPYKYSLIITFPKIPITVGTETFLY